MDLRHTLSVNENFLQLLSACMLQQKKAAMILDTKGLVRIEGVIRNIYPDKPTPYLEMQNGTKIVLSTIVALNGTFIPSFSVC